MKATRDITAKVIIITSITIDHRRRNFNLVNLNFMDKSNLIPFHRGSFRY